MDLLQVIFHVSEPERWKVALTNAQNFINDAGQEKVTIEILANAAGVSIFHASQDNSSHEGMEKMKSLHAQGVTFAVCRNALKMHHIAEHTLPDFINIVPAGITELVLKQKEGYAYIKP